MDIFCGFSAENNIQIKAAITQERLVRLVFNSAGLLPCLQSFRFGKKDWTGFDKGGENRYNMQYCESFLSLFQNIRNLNWRRRMNGTEETGKTFI